MLELPEDQAKGAIVRIAAHFLDGADTDRPTERVLSACTSCFACNLICPKDCRPANLILDIWAQRHRVNGTPVRARYFLPHSASNFRTHAIDRMPEDERAAVEAWKRLDPAEEVFYPGCNIIATPYLTFSRLFEGMDIRGALEYCCGEMYFRMGLYDQVEQAALRTTAYFRTLGVKRVYLSCTAGLNLFTNVLPQFGADFSGIAFASFLKHIHDGLLSGAWPIVKRFDGKTIAIQDSCHAKLYEEEYFVWPRRILETIGFTIVEPTHARQTGLCCGIGCGFAHEAAYAKSRLIAGQRACSKNLTETGADYAAVYCSGCLQMLSAAKYVAWSRTPVYHVLELIQEAIGETPRRRQRAVAFHLLKGVLLNQEGGSARFSVPPLDPDAR